MSHISDSRAKSTLTELLFQCTLSANFITSPTTYDNPNETIKFNNILSRRNYFSGVLLCILVISASGRKYEETVNCANREANITEFNFTCASP